MQTFLPYADFERSARALDAKRLGKQRVETIQVVRALTRPGYGWANHPAVLMWKGYEEALGRYGFCDAVAFTPSRVPEGATCAVVQNYMAHHQGMTVLGLRAGFRVTAAGYNATYQDYRLRLEKGL